MLLVIINLVFLPMVQYSDEEFHCKCEPPALLLIVLLYCFSENINHYKSMVKECRKK